MYYLHYLEQAKLDLLHIKRYIAKESGSNALALRYVEKLRQQCQQLSNLPGAIGRVRPELVEGLRSLPCGNYVILFRYIGDTLEVVSIIEGHRDIDDMFQS